MIANPAAPVARAKRPGIAARLLFWTAGLSVVLFAAVIFSASIGPANVPFSASAGTILHRLGIPAGEATPAQQRIVEQIRLPRILVALLVGAALAASGAALQAVFRNPLADPGIIGVSGGAALGAVIAIGLGFGGAATSLLAIPLAAFAGALLATIAVSFVATAGGRISPSNLVLAGLAVQAFTGANTSLVITMTGDSDLLRNMILWLVGGFDSRLWVHVQMALPIVLGVAALCLLGRDLNVLAQGEEAAHGLGVPVGAVRIIVLGFSALITATAVAVSGPIAFVGLVVPHAMRLLAGTDNRLLIPASALAGAALLVLGDTFARTILQPAELRTGIVSALIGAPFFVFLLWRNRQRIGAW